MRLKSGEPNFVIPPLNSAIFGVDSSAILVFATVGFEKSM